jgi:hypothetical protein
MVGNASTKAMIANTNKFNMDADHPENAETTLEFSLLAYIDSCKMGGDPFCGNLGAGVTGGR